MYVLYIMYNVFSMLLLCNKVINKGDRNASFVNKVSLFLKIQLTRWLFTWQKDYLFYNALTKDVFKWWTIQVNLVHNFIYEKLFTPNKNVKHSSLGLSH